MVEPKARFAGVDWASEAHHVCVVGGDGSKREERIFRHGGVGLAEMADWIAARSGGSASDIPVAIEVPHGPVVESLMDRGFAVYAINPKQLDRFRDRFSPAGAKDDSLDARVLADALRTDLHHFRRIDPVDPIVIELRAWSRIAEELTRDRVRLSNRVREQLWRYYPQILEAVGNVADALVPRPLGQGSDAREGPAGSAPDPREPPQAPQDPADHGRPTPVEILRAPAIAVAPGTTEAAVAHIRSASERLRLVQRQIADAKREIARLIDVLAGSEDSGSGQPGGQRDVTVLSSLPGVGQAVLATLLAEAPQALERRDYKALRCLTGVAPVTRRSGKYKLVVRRMAAHARLRDAVYHWARVAVQRDRRQQGQVRRPSRARPRPCPRPAFGRGPPARGRLRHAQNPDLLPASMPGGGSCGLICSPSAGQPGGPHPRARCGLPQPRRSSGSWLPDPLVAGSQHTPWGHTPCVPCGGWRGAAPPLTPQRQRRVVSAGRGVWVKVRVSDAARAEWHA